MSYIITKLEILNHQQRLWKVPVSRDVFPNTYLNHPVQDFAYSHNFKFTVQNTDVCDVDGPGCGSNVSDAFA